MKTEDFDFDLPPELIVSHPPLHRDAARMLVLDRASGEIHHARFADFASFLKPDDLVALNDTRVVPARFNPLDGGKEILKLGETDHGDWLCLVRPGRHYRVGREVVIGNSRGAVTQVLEDGSRLIRWSTPPPDAEEHGHLALPPYFHREEEPEDRERYQTVFAAAKGSIAAPTAGLHFTSEILCKLPHVFLTLHVGVGTFRPVKVENIADHRMHSESFTVSEGAADKINQAGRVVAVGTTVTRTLEHCARMDQGGPLTPRSGATDIFLKPGDPFHLVGGLLTNFHLPKSTLLMLVSAFAGREPTLAAYRAAVKERYRFFSYGDCMLVL